MSVDAKKLRPLGKRAILKRDKPVGERGGIVVPERFRVHGWNAQIVRLGKDFDGAAKDGDRVFYRRGKTVLPFPDRDYAITSGDFLLARLVPSADYEQIVPLGECVLVDPARDKIAKEDATVQLPQKATRPTTSGTVLRVGEKVKDVQVGDRVVWGDKAFFCACVENDCEIVLVMESDILYKLG